MQSETNETVRSERAVISLWCVICLWLSRNKCIIWFIHEYLCHISHCRCNHKFQLFNIDFRIRLTKMQAENCFLRTEFYFIFIVTYLINVTYLHWKQNINHVTQNITKFKNYTLNKECGNVSVYLSVLFCLSANWTNKRLNDTKEASQHRECHHTCWRRQ